MSEATAFLVEPAEPDDSVTNGFVNPVDVFNYLSPSAWVNNVISSVTGFDPFGYATETFTGEWDKLYQFGDVLGNLAQCLQEIGINVQRSMLRADAEWDGNADDAAYVYFTSLASAISRQQTALYDCVNGYHQAARGAWQLANQLGNILQALVDKTILFGIAAAAGTATAETEVGAVVGYGVAAWQVLEILELANRASTIINTAGSVIAGLFGTGMILGGEGGNLSGVSLPSTSFALPKAAS